MKNSFNSFKYVTNFVFALLLILLNINEIEASKLQQYKPGDVRGVSTPEKPAAGIVCAPDVAPFELFPESSIVPCHSIRDLEAYLPFLTEQDLVLFDLDNAFFEPKREDGVGSDQWFNSGLDYLKRNGIGGNNFFKVMLSVAFEVRSDLLMKPVEGAITLEVVKKIQDTGCRVMALTARSIVKQTFQQLKDIKGVDFSKNAPSDEPFEAKLEKDSIAYKNGILFCGSNDKGTALYTFLEQLELPGFVMFFDDGYKNIEVVQQSTAKRGIAFKGFHYVRLEEKVKNYKFNPESIKPYLKRALENPIESHPNLKCLEQE